MKKKIKANEGEYIVTCFHFILFVLYIGSTQSGSHKGIREVSVVEKYYNLSADRACTLPVAT